MTQHNSLRKFSCNASYQDIKARIHDAMDQEVPEKKPRRFSHPIRIIAPMATLATAILAFAIILPMGVTSHGANKATTDVYHQTDPGKQPDANAQVTATVAHEDAADTGIILPKALETITIQGTVFRKSGKDNPIYTTYADSVRENGDDRSGDLLYAILHSDQEDGFRAEEPEVPYRISAGPSYLFRVWVDYPDQSFILRFAYSEDAEKETAIYQKQ